MNGLVKSGMLALSVLLGACGGTVASPTNDPALGTAQQNDAVPQDCTPSGAISYTIYYSDSTRTVEVGNRYCSCDGIATFNGIQTIWARWTYSGC